MQDTLLLKAQERLKIARTEYPDFGDEARAVCQIFNSLYDGLLLTPEMYTDIYIITKQVREAYCHKEDNLIDIINYTALKGEL